MEVRVRVLLSGTVGGAVTVDCCLILPRRGKRILIDGVELDSGLLAGVLVGATVLGAETGVLGLGTGNGQYGVGLNTF